MIPSLDPLTGYLPPGQYDAAWDEIVSTYGYNLRRLVLLQGLRAVLDNLAVAQCTRAYLNGSFVTAKATPGDFDMCFEPVGVNQAILDPIFKMVGPSRRILQRAKYRGEIASARAAADRHGTLYVNYFQRDIVGRAKGILILDPRDNGGKP